MPLFVYLWLMAQAPVPQLPATPVPETPPVYTSSAGPILIPNLCAELDMPTLGLTCSEAEPCPTYLEFSSVESVGTVLLLAGNLHTTASTLQSILLISEDSGGSWREAHKRLKASALESMQFIDFSTGWLTGQTSIGLPRDPFLLLTTDAGRTWRKVDLFAETRVGVIEDFAFQTAKRGWVLVDNRGSGEAGKYELYETQSGGTSWELREISGRIPQTAQPGQRTPTNTSRVRVDDKKGLLRIETRNGNAWREVSTFKLRLEDCKPDQ
ncbi:MAG: hypothetical protein NTW74_24965 [Acidobacteria bacterium]|nr:hypothetical protein [Acidobacteriota bacterium]